MTGAGKYIVIEGHDGTGKSTQVKLLRDRLSEQGIESIEFHEPQGTPISNEIRTLIKNGELEREGMTNMLLFSAARHDIWFKRAIPALDGGTWVIASRNYLSTLAYQGYGEGLNLETIKIVTEASTNQRYMVPDYTVILDMDDEKERSKRIKSRGKLVNPDTFESKNASFQKRVKNAYLELADEKNIPIISAALAPDAIADKIWDQIVEHFSELSDDEEEPFMSLSAEAA